VPYALVCKDVMFACFVCSFVRCVVCFLGNMFCAVPERAPCPFFLCLRVCLSVDGFRSVTRAIRGGGEPRYGSQKYAHRRLFFFLVCLMTQIPPLFVSFSLLSSIRYRARLLVLRCNTRDRCA
jgi:hypothetical protein